MSGIVLDEVRELRRITLVCAASSEDTLAVYKLGAMGGEDTYIFSAEPDKDMERRVTVHVRKADLVTLIDGLQQFVDQS